MPNQTNSPPVISPIGDQRTFQGQVIEVEFVVNDENLTALILSASSSDQTLVNDDILIISGARQDHTLAITPSPGGFGIAIITIIVEDDVGQEANESFTLEVRDPFASDYEKLTAPDAAAGDGFGTSVGISGDYAIIGSPGDDDGGFNSGSAYMVRK